MGTRRGINRARWGSAFVVSALTAGVLDITYAILFSYFRSGTTPARLLQSVASGALGRDAYAGGAATAALGLGFHFLIAFIITAVFFAAAARVPALTSHPAVTGALYGIGVYLVMNFVVIPLSKIGPRPLPAAIVVVTGVLVHMFLIGFPIASGARRAFRTGSLR
ncbi:MAG TPA: hypothetical protein VFK57_10065 [Vicinamibacterales bacterium]|nr:hypothetical protein [Vicinamibacterales bacterium]